MRVTLKQYRDLFVQYLRTQKLRFALLCVVLLTSIGLQVGIPTVARYFIDAAMRGSDDTTLMFAAVGYIILALMQQAFAVGSVYMGEVVAWNATNKLRADLARHCLRLDMSYHNDTRPGELIERIDGDVTQLSNFFSQLIIMVVGNLLLMAGILVVMFGVDWRLGITFTIFTVTTVYSLFRVRSIAVEPEKESRQAVTEMFGFLEEHLSGTEDIRSSGAVSFVIHQLYRHHYKIYKTRFKAAMTRMWIVITAFLLIATGYGLALILGYGLFSSGVITLGTVYLIVSYTRLLSRPLNELTRQVENLQNAGASLERLEELLQHKTKVYDGEEGAIIPKGALSVSFENVTFGYSAEEPVIKDVSFTLEAGQILGLLGRTGSGKTTIARLLSRLYDPQDGKIFLGGVDTQTALLPALRKRVAIVTQDVQLFQASIRDNLTFFDQSIPDEHLLDVIDKLELGEWLEALPNGLDTRLETGGRSLSAGEAQLLAFTRVFLRNPGLVILDEASSRLDPATENLIERAVEKLLQDRTGIVIAHRLGTVQRADGILILEDGESIEEGVRSELASDTSSRFYDLLQTGLEEVLA